jgi:hypothetical protein
MVNDRLRNSTYNAAICRAVEAWRCENGGSLGDVGPTVRNDDIVSYHYSRDSELCKFIKSME